MANADDMALRSAGNGSIMDMINLFKGSSTTTSGNTTTSSNTSVSGEEVSFEKSQALLASIMEGSQGLAAISGGQKSAGLYNSSTGSLLANDLMARASAQVAALSAKKTSTDTKTTTTGGSTSTTKPSIDGSDALKAGAAAAAAAGVPALLKALEKMLQASKGQSSKGESSKSPSGSSGSKKGSKEGSRPSTSSSQGTAPDKAENPYDEEERTEEILDQEDVVNSEKEAENDTRMDEIMAGLGNALMPNVAGDDPGNEGESIDPNDSAVEDDTGMLDGDSGDIAEDMGTEDSSSEEDSGDSDPEFNYDFSGGGDEEDFSSFFGE